jgi:hypothetical protein
MGRLVKLHNGETLVAHNFVATPTYTLYVADYAGGATPPHGWEYFADDVTLEDFAPIWKQSVYALGDIVVHNGTRWRSLIAGNVWEPGISGWRDADADIPAWIQPTGAHDAYVKDAVVNHGGQLWNSLVEANVWQPGVANWRKFSMIPPSGVTAPEAWIQPTGAGDAYALDALVTHNGFTWKSLYAANVWEPGVYGWEQQ